jgi:hypothetical protein
MPQIEQKISTVDKVDVAIVRVSPARGPGLRNFKIVAAVSEVRPASDDLDVTDREVVIVAKMGTKMFVVDSTGMLVMLVLIFSFFLSSTFVVLMLVLGKRRNHSREKYGGANRSDCCESFHVKPLQVSFRSRRTRAFVTKPKVTESRCG